MMNATNKLILSYFPCTGSFCASDVGLNKPFKSRMRDQWKNWLDVPVEDQEYTKTGKRKTVRNCDCDSLKKIISCFIHIWVIRM